MSAVAHRLAGAVLAVAAVLVPAVPAGAATPQAPETSRVTVAIGEVSPAVLHPGEDLTVTATLHNAGPTAVQDVTAVLRLNRFRPASRSDLDAWASGAGGASGSRVAVGEPHTLPAGGSVTVQLKLPAATVRLLDLPDTWGPRGLAVEATTGGVRLGIQRTFLLWMRDEAVPQVRVSVLAPVTGPPPGATDELVAATAANGRLRALADLAAAERDVELVVDPALLEAVASDGPVPGSWAAQLGAALGLREGFALPWGDVDLAAVAHAGRPALLDLALAMSAEAGLAGVPARTDVLWAPDGELDQATVTAVQAAGARALVVGPRTLQAPDGVTPARAELGTGALAALVPDRLVTELFTDPGAVEPGATTATATQRLLAEVAVLAHDGSSDPHHVLVAPGRDWTPDVEHVSALLSALRTSPWSRLVPVNALLGAQPDAVAGELPPAVAGQGELGADDVRELADARDATLGFAAAIGDTGALTGWLDRAVLAPLSHAWRDRDAGRADQVRTFVERTSAERTGLALAPVGGLNVISSSAPVRFVLRNDMAIPATVAVQVTPRKACLRPARSDMQTVEPGAEVPVVVELEAAANCDVVVDATLVGQDGTAVGDGVRFTARVAPTIESVGTVVVVVLLAVGLVLGLVRTVRRGRSARRGGVAEDTR